MLFTKSRGLPPTPSSWGKPLIGVLFELNFLLCTCDVNFLVINPNCYVSLSDSTKSCCYFCSLLFDSCLTWILVIFKPKTALWNGALLELNFQFILVCILPQPAFYSQSAVCSLHFTHNLHFIPGPQSAVRSPQSSFYTDRLRKTVTFPKIHVPVFLCGVIVKILVEM